MKIFETKNELQQAKLTEDQLVQTKGGTTANDNQDNFYFIRTPAQYDGTPDEVNDLTLANGNIAQVLGSFHTELTADQVAGTEAINVSPVYTRQFLLVQVNGTDASDYRVTGDNQITLTAGKYNAGDDIFVDQNGIGERYLQNAVNLYDSVAAMKADSIRPGLIVGTRSYYNTSASDTSGAAFYRSMTAAEFGGTPDQFGDHTDAGGNILKLIVNGIYHVDQYGARGDWNGTTGTSDSDVFQAVFDAIEAAGGGAVELNGSRQYRTTYTMFYGSNMHFRGNGAEVFWDSLTTDGTCFMPFTYQQANDTNYTEDFSFRDFKLNTPTDKGNGIGVPKARYGLIENVNCDFIFWHLYEGAGGKNIEVRNCHVKSCEKDAFQVDNLTAAGGAKAVDPMGIETDSAIGTVNDDWAISRDILIEGNTAENCALSGYHLHRTGGKRIKVVNNIAVDCATGIRTDNNADWAQVDLTNNTLIRNTIAIQWLSRFEQLTISGNSIFGGPDGARLDEGVFMPQAATTGRTTLIFANNNIQGYEKAFAIDHCDGASITGNVFYKCSSETAVGSEAGAKLPTTYAIGLFGTQNAAITGNQFYFCEACAIRIRKGNLTSNGGKAVDISITGNVSRRSGPFTIRNVLYLSMTGNTSALETGGFINFYFLGCQRGVVSANTAFNDTNNGTLFYSENGDVMYFNANRGRMSGSVTGRAGILIDGGTKEYVGDTLVDGDYSTADQVLFINGANGESHEPYERGRVGNTGGGTVTSLEHTVGTIP